MDILIALILIVFLLWAAGFALSIGGGFIHLLLVVVLLLVLIRLLQGNRVV